MQDRLQEIRERAAHLQAFYHTLTNTEKQSADDLLCLMDEIEHYQQWINDLQSGMYVNCVYCGHRYGPEDKVPTSMADALKEHVENCPKHPMSALKQNIARLKEAQRWIPVTERLPDTNDLVIGTNINEKGEDRWVSGCYYHMGYWYDWRDNECTITPTHWMPLPAAPEAPEQEGAGYLCCVMQEDFLLLFRQYHSASPSPASCGPRHSKQL